MKAAIFVGPTLSGHDFASDENILWLPPAAVGDIYKIARARPLVIGLIDGQFEIVPAVWHKEILWALSEGIHVYGAASIGALRAAELSDFGMVGVGSIFEDFRDGILEDDDEVALIHASSELDYQSLTEPMVDIRATLAAATSASVICSQTSEALLKIAKEVFFKERTWNTILEMALRNHLPKTTISSLRRWLATGRVEQKRMDALAMIDVISRHLLALHSRFQANFVFQHTQYWQRLVDFVNDS